MKSRSLVVLVVVAALCIIYVLAVRRNTANTSLAPSPSPSLMPTSVPTLVPERTSSVPASTSGSLRAFPGAEGFGAQTPGGRGGTILYVTNLDDSGSGSLRAAVEATKPRIVLFKVAGTITLQSDIDISSPYITIAGQSAPGEGIQIKGGMLRVKTHDVVLRYLKIRPGDRRNTSDPDSRDALSLSGINGEEVYNVVIDHSSLVWGPDIGGVSILVNTHDVTIQDSIIGEGLYYSTHAEGAREGGHSKGLNITTLTDEYGSGRPTRVTVHHNLLTTSDDRMPQVIEGVNIDIVNNVIYNWGKVAGRGNPVSLNLIKNLFVKGPMSEHLVAWSPLPINFDPVLRNETVYEEGNETEGFKTVRGDPQSVYTNTRFTPYSMETEQTPQEAYARVVADAGASRPVRDSVDARIITNLVNGKGRFLSGKDLAWPQLDTGPVPTDDDADGMSDAWEQEHFGTTSRGDSSDSSSDFDGDGYTDVEEYLNLTDPTISGAEK